ncbi:hypothetical protein HPP92_011628 [Vanilla planifolia]|uniref:Uncharacterized protein n=1 Tax=Vanilla planifolia TaxID=51239 RepID=A0A835R358_VANPL|nr:hypothetical protein HPP92_011628 [Vanilla planifolia]
MAISARSALVLAVLLLALPALEAACFDRCYNSCTENMIHCTAECLNKCLAPSSKIDVKGTEPLLKDAPSKSRKLVQLQHGNN